MRIEDVVDPTVGFMADLKIGDRVSAGDTIGVVYCEDDANAREAARRIQNAYRISEEPPSDHEKLIKEIINE